MKPGAPHRVRLAVRALLLRWVIVAIALGAGGAGLSASAAVPGEAVAARAPAGTFVSMIPACACGRRTELELFSASSGRVLRRLAPVLTGGYQVSTPAAARDGRLFFTFTSGPRCAARGVYAECPQFAPDSCRNMVASFSPGHRQLQPLFTVAGSASVIGGVVPSPDDRRVALTLTPCVGVTCSCVT